MLGHVMNHYKIYTMDRIGRIQLAQDVQCADDHSAMMEGVQQHSPFGVEVWQGARMVGVVGPEAPRRQQRSA